MKAHRTDLLSFAFGLVFLALSAWWLLAQLLGLALPPVGWFLAGALILIGVFGLVGALRSGRSTRPEPHETTEPVATAPAATVAPVATEQDTSWTAAFEPPVYAPTAFGATPDAALRTPEPPTAALRTPEPPTAELRTADASTAGMVHPAWLAHATAEPETPPVAAQAAASTRVDQSDGENGAADTSGADRDPAARDDHTTDDHATEDRTTGDDPAGVDERPGRREGS